MNTCAFFCISCNQFSSNEKNWFVVYQCCSAGSSVSVSYLLVKEFCDVAQDTVQVACSYSIGSWQRSKVINIV